MKNTVRILIIITDFVMRDLRLRYAGSLAGVFWGIGIPALNAIVLSAVFSVLMDGRMGVDYENVPFALFYFAGFAPWLLFVEATSRASGLFVDNATLVKRVRFPLETLCVQIVCSALPGHAVLLAATAVLMFSHGIPPSWVLIQLPAFLVLAMALTLGTVFLVSALGVFLRDLVQLVPVLLHLGFFLTPILYPPNLLEAAPAWARMVLLVLNPWHHVVAGYRHAILGMLIPDPVGLAWAWACAALLLAGGIFVFRRLKGGFADVL